MSRPRIERARAVLRLVRDRDLVPLADLVGHANASERSLIRWIIEGRKGVYLDGLHRPGVGWMSSRAAVARFLVGQAQAV